MSRKNGREETPAIATRSSKRLRYFPFSLPLYLRLTKFPSRLQSPEAAPTPGEQDAVTLASGLGATGAALAAVGVSGSLSSVNTSTDVPVAVSPRPSLLNAPAGLQMGGRELSGNTTPVSAQPIPAPITAPSACNIEATPAVSGGLAAASVGPRVAAPTADTAVSSRSSLAPRSRDAADVVSSVSAHVQQAPIGFHEGLQTSDSVHAPAADTSAATSGVTVPGKPNNLRLHTLCSLSMADSIVPDAVGLGNAKTSGSEAPSSVPRSSRADLAPSFMPGKST